MSTPITEAHLGLSARVVEHVFRFAEGYSGITKKVAQLIADSEAKACEQLRADCDNETKWAAHYLADALAAKARADRAEAELATERARLDWLVKSSDNPLAINLFPSYGWTEVKKNLRASIDAAMKEGAK